MGKHPYSLPLWKRVSSSLLKNVYPSTQQLLSQLTALVNTAAHGIAHGAASTISMPLDASFPTQPAHFYIVSTPSHTTYPTTYIPINLAEPVHLGSIANSNERTINKYIHPDGVKSCQLVMSLTLLEPNNM
jgi:5-keto 4-deoxyuronate isomerase